MGAPGATALDAIIADDAQPADPRNRQTTTMAATRPRDRCNTGLLLGANGDAGSA
jgi:hypothetical protein